MDTKPRKPVDKSRTKNAKGNHRFPMVATTLQGLEDVLAKELVSIGANEVKTGKRAVYFTADTDLLYKANLRLRTALRLLKPIQRFRASTEDELYNQVKSIDWTALFDVEKTFSIKAAVSGKLFTHSHYASLKCKDAIVDQFRDKFGKRPDVSPRYADFVIHLKIYNDEVTISLDSSGEPLNKRGYRQREAAAPINEVLAAGLLKIAGYEGKRNFVDGMCGSGTICIEAALIAHKIAPGLLRKSFAFMNWKDFDEELFDIIREATVNRIKEAPVRIVGYDSEFHAINLARKAAIAAGVEDAVKFSMGSFFDAEPPEAPGILVMNPPYGERIKAFQIEKMYSEIGDKFKKSYAGYQAWILSGNEEAMKNVGLRTFDTRHLVNGKIDCRYSGFKIYTGKK
jgi:putative N6-adenine-specific DNA methylase